MCPKSHEHSDSSHGEAASIIDEKENTKHSCPLSFPRRPHLPITMPESSLPNLVYRRRKLQGASVSFLSAQALASRKRSGEDCLSIISSDTPSVATKEHNLDSQDKYETEAVGAPFMSIRDCNGELCILKSESINGCSFVENLGSDEAFKNGRQKIIDIDSINDSCSSSKSNVNLFSACMKTEVDDTSECSSSSVMVPAVMGEDSSEKDLCNSILKHQEVSEAVGPSRTPTSTERVGDCGGTSGFRTCKVCTRAESSLKMLICDNCDEAFHASCCNPRVKRIPSDEWLCHSCLKKKHKIPETISRKSPNIIIERGRCRDASSTGESNPIALMFIDTEPYTPGVRVGKGFQAEVPDWSGPIHNDVNTIAEPQEMDPSDFVSMHALKCNKPFKLGSIGNWLQCRTVTDAGEGSNGTTCGKWRRAPLFEIQTDDWECFCSVFWDPIHADCAASQELETDEVLKQIKYVQMSDWIAWNVFFELLNPWLVLRPQLDAKRRKLERTKRANPLDKTKGATS